MEDAGAAARVPVLLRRAVPCVPLWVEELDGLAVLEPASPRRDGVEVRKACTDTLSRLQVVIEGVTSMDVLTLQQVVAEGYRSIFNQLTRLPTPYPIRFWAFVPSIHAGLGAGLDRYMAFNAGRFDAYSAWCGGREALGASVATASAVGIEGDRLEVHCLAGREPGRPVENPRQIPAYRYSRRYGPLPPCFARATAVAAADGRRRLLVGGTASIRGEDSFHSGDVRQQTAETLRNLASLVRSAQEGPSDTEVDPNEQRKHLSCFRELRIYRPRLEDSDAIVEALADHFSGVTRMELLQAELCRRELSVELEGVADLGPPPSLAAS